jgi:hypothetical protein
MHTKGPRTGEDEVRRGGEDDGYVAAMADVSTGGGTGAVSREAS